MTSQSNKDLQMFYDQSYSIGESKVFTFFENGKHISEDHAAALDLLDWNGKIVLDVGCGTGTLVRGIAAKGAAKVIGLDFSDPAIQEAKSIGKPDTVEFVTAEIMSWTPPVPFDVIVTLGTMEHLDDPARFLQKMSEFLADEGTIVIACPHFINPRGYVWMALATLLDVPMSLSDLHFIHPWHMKAWASKVGMDAELVCTVDRNWAYGPRLLKDFEKRLRNALRDVKLPIEKVDNYLSYLNHLVVHLEEEPITPGLEGATALYRLTHQ